MRLFRQQVASAEALSRSGNFTGAFRALEGVADSALFEQLPLADQARLLSVAGWAALRLDKPVQARDLYRRATALASEEPDDWYRLTFLELQLGASDRACTTMRYFVQHWPERLPNIDVTLIPRLVFQGDPASTARMELMQALFDANWRDPAATGAVWYELAVAHVARGQLDAARPMLHRIRSPNAIVRLRADKRFDSMVSPGDYSMDPVLAARQLLDTLANVAEASPDQIDPRVQLSYEMLDLGLYDDVIALADRTIAEIADAPIGQPRFVDVDGQVWLMDNRSIALRKLGRIDESLAELQRARTLNEKGGLNVSQALNLGGLYCFLDRPREALAEIVTLGNVSGYGRMTMKLVEHCAAVELGNHADADRALDYLRQHSEDGPLLLLHALLRESHMQEAATHVTALLADPYKRGEILDWMQGYIETEPLPGEIDYRENRGRLLARPDVLAALDAVGRIEQFQLHATYH